MDKWELVEAAHTPKEKMDAMIEFLKYVPHHKGTMKLRGEMNRKISLIRADLDKKKRMGTGKSSGGPKLSIEKQGSAQSGVNRHDQRGQKLLNEGHNKFKSSCYTYTLQHP